MSEPTVEEVREALERGLLAWEPTDWVKLDHADYELLVAVVRLFVDAAEPDIEAAGEAAWRVVAIEKGLIDEGFEWDDLIASDSQSFWIDVGKAALAAAFGDNTLIRRAE